MSVSPIVFQFNEGALDCCVLDADLDGDLDLFTAQIENGNKLWVPCLVGDLQVRTAIANLFLTGAQMVAVLH